MMETLGAGTPFEIIDATLAALWFLGWAALLGFVVLFGW